LKTATFLALFWDAVNLEKSVYNRKHTHARTIKHRTAADSMLAGTENWWLVAMRKKLRCISRGDQTNAPPTINHPDRHFFFILQHQSRSNALYIGQTLKISPSFWGVHRPNSLMINVHVKVRNVNMKNMALTAKALNEKVMLRCIRFMIAVVRV